MNEWYGALYSIVWTDFFGLTSSMGFDDVDEAMEFYKGLDDGGACQTVSMTRTRDHINGWLDEDNYVHYYS